jgi:hypothetical protein
MCVFVFAKSIQSSLTALIDRINSIYAFSPILSQGIDEQSLLKGISLKLTGGQMKFVTANHVIACKMRGRGRMN